MNGWSQFFAPTHTIQFQSTGKMTVTFTPSQLSYDQDTSPINFRLSPSSLLYFDIKLLPFLIFNILQTVSPYSSSNPRDELNLQNYGNLITIILQIALAVTTIIGFIGGVIAIFLPIPIVVIASYIAIAAVLFSKGDFYDSKLTSSSRNVFEFRR